MLGVGHEQMKMVMATLKILPVANSTWKRYEQSVESEVEESIEEGGCGGGEASHFDLISVSFTASVFLMML